MDKAPDLGVDRWHARFAEQARWTRQVRRYLLEQIKLPPSGKMLEIGCGTGVVTTDLAEHLQVEMHGIDIHLPFLKKARSVSNINHYLCADAYALPYPDRSVDVCFCHFLLLWLTDPLAALSEMARVTKKSGWLIILAEPDYGGRIDYPLELVKTGKWQTEALENQGANPLMGRSVAHLLVQAGCFNVRSGLMGGQWGFRSDLNQLDSEWEMLKADLKDAYSIKVLNQILDEDRKAWENGYRILFVPTFYAWGQNG